MQSGTTPIPSSMYEFSKDSVQTKSDKRYGAKFAQTILDALKNQSSYFSLRNAKFRQAEAFSMGEQDMQEYLDRMNIDGKEAFVNLDLTPPAFAPKFLEILIARFMERRERPTVKAVDKGSKKKRQRQKDEAEFRMRKGGDVIEPLSGMAGISLEDPEAYTPTDKEDLELWHEFENFLDEEVSFEKMITDTLEDSSYEIHKRALLTDLAVKGMAVAYTYRDANGNKKYRRCIPDNVLYLSTDRDDFADCKLIGEIERMKIADARQCYPQISEQQWFKMFQSVSKNTDLAWDNTFAHSLIRPYDDCEIEVFRFAVITTEDRHWVASTDKPGKLHVDEKQARPVYPNGAPPAGKEPIAKKIQVVYEGCYSTALREMLYWQMQKQMIKPHYALHEVFGPYCVVMPNQRQMVNKSMMMRAIPIIKQLILVHLRLQVMIAKMRPDGWAIDIAGLHDVDLGLGRKSSPLELQRVSDQTGYVYFSSRDEDGNLIQDPIRPIENNNVVSKIESLIAAHNFYLQRLRDDLGTNEYVEGQGVNPKLGLGIRDGQVEASNRATDFLYKYYIILLEQIALRFAVMEWYDIMDGKRDEEYGIKKEDYIDLQPDVHITMLPTDEEQQYLTVITEKAITAGSITFEEAFKVRRLAKTNVRLAEIYLAKYEKMRKAQAIQENQANIQATAQAQQQSNAQTHNNTLQIEQLKGQSKLEQIKTQGDYASNAFVESLILEFAKLGQPVSPEYMPLVQQYLDNRTLSQGLENMDKQSKAIAVQQQQQFAQQQPAQ
jgi:hypothetical protein